MERIEFIMFKKYALMFLVSMVPLIELRGSIPIGLSMGLNPLWLYIICIVGNMLPVPFIFFFADKIISFKPKPMTDNDYHYVLFN